MNQEMFFQVLWTALSDLTKSLSRTLAKSGLAIMLLAAFGIAQGYYIWTVESRRIDDRHECKAEMLALKAEFSETLREHRAALFSCDAERQRLAVQLAEIRGEIKRLKTKH